MRPGDVAKCILRAQRVAGVEPVVDGQQGEAVAFSAARLGSQADVGASGLLVLAVLCEARGAGFGGTSKRSATGRSTRGYDERQ